MDAADILDISGDNFKAKFTVEEDAEVLPPDEDDEENKEEEELPKVTCNVEASVYEVEPNESE